jgi:RNA 2',3'-cyclic 3'-phosphodiesterase
MRTFIAFPISKAALVYAGELQIEIGRKNKMTNIRWVEPQKMHVTLEFFADISEEQKSLVQQIIKDKSEDQGPFVLTAERVDGLPNADYPDTIVVKLTPSPEAIKAQKDIHDALAQTGIPVQEREWHPHLTLGRMKERKKVTCLRDIQVEKVSWQTDEIRFVESVMTKNGYEYQSID